MASGDRRARAERQAVLIRLPPDLVTLIDIHVISHRYHSRAEAIQRLLETHPELVNLAERVYTVYQNTSPRSP